MVQWPPASQLPYLWSTNREALIALIEASHIGTTLSSFHETQLNLSINQLNHIVHEFDANGLCVY
jgi:hypothetical protein